MLQTLCICVLIHGTPNQWEREHTAILEVIIKIAFMPTIRVRTISSTILDICPCKCGMLRVPGSRTPALWLLWTQVPL